MADYAISLFRALKRERPNIGIRVTGGNDLYHYRLNYNSSHKSGNALDFVVQPSTPTNLQYVDSLIARFVAGNRDIQASYINEYNNASIASTGKHFHLRVGGVDPMARPNIENIYAQADRGEINPLII